MGNPTSQLLKYYFSTFCLWWFSGTSNHSTVKNLIFSVFAYGGLLDEMQPLNCVVWSELGRFEALAFVEGTNPNQQSKPPGRGKLIEKARPCTLDVVLICGKKGRGGGGGVEARNHSLPLIGLKFDFGQVICFFTLYTRVPVDVSNDNVRILMSMYTV